MSDGDIRTGIDHLLEQLEATHAVTVAECERWKAQADLFRAQLAATEKDRDRLQQRVNELER